MKPMWTALHMIWWPNVVLAASPNSTSTWIIYEIEVLFVGKRMV